MNIYKVSLYQIYIRNQLDPSTLRDEYWVVANTYSMAERLSKPMIKDRTIAKIELFQKADSVESTEEGQ